ncbi:MAG: histidine phosphatase family protein [Pseudomonadota bacterium]
MRLYLVRHPRPDLPSGTCYGRSDVAVPPEQQALVLQALISVLPRGAPLYSSPLLRCSGLASELANALDCGAAIPDPRLAEMDFGSWEMRAWNDIKREEIDAWVKDLVDYRPGGGESVLDMARRVRAFHDEMQQRRHHHAIVICHAGTIRLLLACQRGLPLADMALHAGRTAHKIDYGEVMIIDC